MAEDLWRYLYKDMLAHLPGKISEAVKHVDLMVSVLGRHIDKSEVEWLREVRTALARVEQEVTKKLYEL